MHISSIEFHEEGIGFTGASYATSRVGDDKEPLTFVIEDCKFFNTFGTSISGIPNKSLLYRTIVSHSWVSSKSHVQGYYDSGYKRHVTMDETIFYRNGFKEDPLTNADPERDTYCRNIYQGGGAQMGYTYRNLISADGASGGPQMRLGGLMENSLIIEGYWFSSTENNSEPNPWFGEFGQVGRTAIVRNNVQLPYKIMTSEDPGNPQSQGTSQAGNGYTLQGASWNSIFEGNIISGALIADDLLDRAGVAMQIHGQDDVYNGIKYDQKNNIIRDNIFYRMGTGLMIEGGEYNIIPRDISDVRNIVVENNVFAPIDRFGINYTDGTLTSRSQIAVRNNRIYAPSIFEDVDWIYDNSIDIVESDLVVSTAQAAEKWLDPDRTLKRYVTEKLGLDLLDWADDPYVDKNQAQERISKNEKYDPTGMKTFMAVATNMRHGGADTIPSSGKPSLTGDYPWDKRFTAVAVVNWIREGFNLDPVGPGDSPVNRTNLPGVLLLLLDS